MNRADFAAAVGIDLEKHKEYPPGTPEGIRYMQSISIEELSYRLVSTDALMVAQILGMQPLEAQMLEHVMVQRYASGTALILKEWLDAHGCTITVKPLEETRHAD